MATKLGRVVTYHERHKITWLFDHVIFQDHVTNWNDYNSTNRVTIATKLGSVVSHLDGLLSLKSNDLLITWSHEITLQTQTIISPLPLPLHYSGDLPWGLLTIKSYSALITWSYKITWQTKIFISLSTKYLWSPNLTEWYLSLTSLPYLTYSLQPGGCTSKLPYP